MIDGRPEAPILVVGMAPGREELAQDRPFIGGSGRLLWSLAKRGGWTRNDCYILNVIGEWPAKADGNPSQEQLERYWDTFNDALIRSSARVAVCLGGIAFDRLTNIISAERLAKRRSGIESWRGYLVRPADCHPHTRKVVRHEQYKTTTKLHKKGDPKVVKHKLVEAIPLPSSLEYILPTLHPAAVLRTGYKTIPALAADLARVRRVLDGTLRTSEVSFVEHPCVGEAGDFVSVDIETRQTPGGDTIVRAGSSSSRGTWTRPWDYLAKIGVESETANPLKVKVFHNAPFDIPRLEAEGVQFRGLLWDTMLCAATLQPDLPKALNSVASLVLDTERWKHLSDDRPDYYNALDAARTREIALYQIEELKRTGQYEWFTQGVMPAVPTLIAMTKRGIKMDADRRTRWLEELSADETEREARWRTLTGGVHPASPKQVQEYLYGTLGLPAQYSATGGRSANIDALRELLAVLEGKGDGKSKRAIDVLRGLIEYRAISKLRSTYAERILGDDGCVHPSYLPASKDEEDLEYGKGLAGTGRITSRDPNIQNQPQAARKLFVPHSSDLILVEADYSQIELRIAAALSGDRALQEALQGDVHARTQELLGVDRVRAKNLIYGSLYGAGPRKLVKVLRAKGFAITEHDARNLQDALARAYPDLWAWRQKVVEEAGNVYYLSTPFGQRRYFWQGRREAPAAIDFIPQGTAAGIMWQILPDLERRLADVGGALLTCVHDSILAEVPRARLDEGVAGMVQSMERTWPQITPDFMVPVEVKTGENWGEMKPWKALDSGS